MKKEGSVYLVGYDVAGVHRYVFEPIRPVDVAGGSLLLERFASEAVEVARVLGASEIYSAGGTGLFQAGDEQAAADLAEQLRRTLDRMTAGGATCTTAWVECSGAFRTDRLRLAEELRRTRFQEALEASPQQLLPAATWPSDVCEACGREVRTTTRSVGGQAEGIGRRCEARYREGKGKAPTIAEVFGAQSDEVPRGALLAAVYVDADELGARVAKAESPDELSRFSRSLSKEVNDAIADAESRLSGRRILKVAVGGDDALLFCDAAELAALTEAVWTHLGRAASALGVRFSTGIAFGEPFLPLRLYFEAAEVALRTAKSRSHAGGRPHVGVRTLMARPRVVPGDALGGPVPQEAFMGYEGLWTLVDGVRDIVPAQRAGLGEDLAVGSREEAELAVQYRATRDASIAHVLSQAKELAAAHNLNYLTLLAGVLALAGSVRAVSDRVTREAVSA